MTEQPDKQINPPTVSADKKAEVPSPAPDKPAVEEAAPEKPAANNSAAAEKPAAAPPSSDKPAPITAPAAPLASEPPAAKSDSRPVSTPLTPPATSDKPADQPAAEPAKSPPFTEDPLAANLEKKPDAPAATDVSKVSSPLDTVPSGTKTAPVDSLLAAAKAPAPAAGQLCPNCGHRNRPGVLLCENCGTNLTTGKQLSIGTRDLKRDPVTSSLEGASVLDTNQTKAIESAGSGTFTDSMVLRIEIEGAATPMLVYPKQEIILGRRDPNTGAMPDVDLTAYAGYRMGVSRSHAAIRFQDRQLHVSDLGSSNGTFLNGTRLNAHRPYQLRDGDEVRLGQMVLRLFFQVNRK